MLVFASIVATLGACATGGADLSSPTSDGGPPPVDAGNLPDHAAPNKPETGGACGAEGEPCCGSICNGDLACTQGYCWPQTLGDAGASGDDASSPIDSGTQGCSAGLTQCATSCIDLTSDTHNCGACAHDCLGQTCSNGACTPIVLSSSFVPPGRLTLDSNNLYFTNADGAVRSVPLAGGATSTLVTGQASPEGIAVDATNAYFANNGDGTIKSVPVQGGSATLLAQNQPNPFALQVGGANVYWTTLASGAGNGTLESCAKTGCNLTPATLATGLQYSFGLRVDASNVYWSTLNGGGEVHYVPTGGGVDTAVASQLSYPYDIALSGNTIVVVTYGGPGRVLMVPTPGDAGPGTATLLVGAQYFAKNVWADGTNAYWTLDNPTSSGGTVFECALSGCNNAPLLLAYGFQPCEAIVSDATYVYWLSNDGTVLKTPK
jgi:Stigma-specific protein, Stig1